MKLRSILATAVGAAVAATIAVAPMMSPPAAAADTWVDVASGPQPDANPLKGFIPFKGSYSTFPHSMEWSYFPVSAVVTAQNTYDWSSIDTALEQIRSRGHQTALRFYLDIPGLPSGVPQYLLNQNLVTTRAYSDYGNNGQSVAPDYDDPDLRAAVTAFIQQLGARYDGDPRIGYLHLGILGFWGEWHTYPYNGTEGNPNWMASASTQQEVLTAFTNAFTQTPLEVRYPTSLNKNLNVGYHDDSFAYTTKQSSYGWFFMDDMVREGTDQKWKTNSIGGELRPELQLCLFTPTGCTGNDRDSIGDYDFAGSLAQTHATWLMNHKAFDPGLSGTPKTNAIAASKSMGYAFRVSKVLDPGTVALGSTTTNLGVQITNDGVAPFYRNWPVSLRLINSSGAVAWSTTTNWSMKTIPAGETRTFTTAANLSSLPAGTYRLLAQVANPMTGGMPIRFGNAGQDTVQNGWLTLSTLSVSASTNPTPVVTYEAEAASNTRTGGAVVASCAPCSNGSKVGYIGNGATLTFNGVAGTSSSVRVYYASAVARTATVRVDSGTPVTVNFPATADWNTVGYVDVPVAVSSESGHTVTIGNASAWAPDIDRIVVGGS